MQYSTVREYDESHRSAVTLNGLFDKLKVPIFFIDTFV